MDPTLIVPGLIAGSGVLLLAAIVWERWRERQRTEALTEWASGAGFSIEPGSSAPGASGLAPGLTARPVFSRGRRARLVNIMKGRSAFGAVVITDHIYVVGSGKNSSTITQTLVAVELDGSPLPAFVLGPEGIFSRIGQVFGSQDIDFDSSPSFSGAYQLKGPDEDAIRRVFERNAVPYFSENRGWSVEADGAWIVVYRQGRRAKTDDMTAFLERALTVVQVIASGGR